MKRRTSKVGSSRRATRPRKKTLALIPLLPFATFAMFDSAHAANLVVSTLTDDRTPNDQCSLREAMFNADGNNQSGSTDCPAGDGEDTITFSVGGTITLSSTLPLIGDSAGLTIDGGGDVTISGNNAVRIALVGFEATLTVQNLVLANGADVGSGAGVFNFGTLNVVNSTLSGNKAGDEDGGAIFNDSGGTVNVSNSRFEKNVSTEGGAILNLGFLNIGDSTLLQNSSRFGNGGAIRNHGTLTAGSSTFSGNRGYLGGAIFTTNGTVTVTNCTFAGNSADSGGAIRSFGDTLDVINSTFSRNSADTGGGISHSGGTATLRNTLLANSTTGGNCAGTITDGGGNLDDAATCGFTQASSQSNASPGLDPAGLKDNGGPTQTIALIAGASDAIDKGVNSICSSLASNVDQRGVARPADGNNDSVATCDIGAFELSLEPPPPPLPPPPPPPDTCSGQSASAGCTVNGVAEQACLGTPGDDSIVGTAAADIIFGFEGNDTITGAAGADLICGGEGNDTLSGGKGKDQLFGEDGDDTVRGGRGGDAIDGGSGNDACLGGLGNDSAAECETVSNVP